MKYTHPTCFGDGSGRVAARVHSLGTGYFGVAPSSPHLFDDNSPPVAIHMQDVGGAPPIDILAEPTTQTVWKGTLSITKIRFHSGNVGSAKVTITKNGKPAKDVEVCFRSDDSADNSRPISLYDGEIGDLKGANKNADGITNADDKVIVGIKGRGDKTGTGTINVTFKNPDDKDGKEITVGTITVTVLEK